MTKPLYALLIAAITALSLTACTIGEEGDDYMPIGSIDQLIGDWAGAVDTQAEESGQPDITFTARHAVDVEIRRAWIYGTHTITRTYTGSGLNSTSWGTIKSGLPADYAPDDDNYTATLTNTVNKDIKGTWDLFGYKISPDGKKLTVPPNTFPGTPVEIILDKKES